MKVPELKQDSYATCSKECSRIYFNNIQKERHLRATTDSICEYCGKQYRFQISARKDGKSRFCCMPCRNKWESENKTGENHHNYNKKYSKEKIEQMRRITVKLYEDGVYNRTQTKPQIITNSILDNNNISYKNEYGFKYYLIDNYLLDYELPIEVMGDYFHSNPLKHKELNNMQRVNVTRDKRKRTYLRRYHNMEILYLWEGDLNANYNMCEKLILHYIKNNGIIENYNSFNYEIIDGQLKLKVNTTLPYIDIPNKNIKHIEKTRND